MSKTMKGIPTTEVAGYSFDPPTGVKVSNFIPPRGVPEYNHLPPTVVAVDISGGGVFSEVNIEGA